MSRNLFPTLRPKLRESKRLRRFVKFPFLLFFVVVFLFMAHSSAYAADRYWVGSSGNWSDTAHWGSASGVVDNSTVPTSSDDVFIDANSGLGSGTETITLYAGNGIFNDFTSNSGHSYTISGIDGSRGFSIYGSLTLESGIIFDNLGSVEFLSTSIGETITTAGISLSMFGYGVYFMGTGSWTLQDNLVITGEFNQGSGTFDANNHNVTANDFYFYADAGYTPTVIMGSGTWEATGNGNIWLVDQYSGEVVTITPETSTIKFTDATASDKTFANTTGLGHTYNNLWLTGAGTGNFIIQGSNTFNDFKVDTPPHTVKFTQGTTTTVSTFTVSGTVGNLITIVSVDGATQHTLSKSSGTVSSDYLDISNSNATGGAAWYAGANSLDTTNNDGWIFTDAPTPTPTEAPASTSSSPDTSTWTSSTFTPVCQDLVPGSSPNLFQIDVTNTTAKLYFAPAKNPINKYFIAYSLNKNVLMYGVEYSQGYSSGVLSYTINLLKPNTTYYFKVRGGNGCITGSWSGTLGVKTTSSKFIKKSFYLWSCLNGKTNPLACVK